MREAGGMELAVSDVFEFSVEHETVFGATEISCERGCDWVGVVHVVQTINLGK